MATRRIISDGKTILEKDDTVGSSPAADQQSNIAPAVPTDVIVKLLAFTFAMIVMPIGSYFATVNTIFKGKDPHDEQRRQDVYSCRPPNSLTLTHTYITKCADVQSAR